MALLLLRFAGFDVESDDWEAESRKRAGSATLLGTAAGSADSRSIVGTVDLGSIGGVPRASVCLRVVGVNQVQRTRPHAAARKGKRTDEDSSSKA